jgi:DNA invertase Pin-like site-specific DNA recombinase
VHVLGLGEIGKGVGELILAVLAQVAVIERNSMIERTRHGREVAIASLAKTGLTHRGKKKPRASLLGRCKNGHRMAKRWKIQPGRDCEELQFVRGNN